MHGTCIKIIYQLHVSARLVHHQSLLPPSNQTTFIIIIIIIIIYLTANGLSPGGSGYNAGTWI